MAATGSQHLSIQKKKFINRKEVKREINAEAFYPKGPTLNE